MELSNLTKIINGSVHESCADDQGSTNSNTECLDPSIRWMQELTTLVFTILNIAMSLGILVGNSFVVIAFVRFRFVRTVHNGLLLGMSTADLLTAPGIILANVLGNFFLDSDHAREVCVFTAWLFAICFEGQMCMLLLITINRLVSIRYPLTHHIVFSRRRTLALALSVWAVLLTLDTGCMIPNRWVPGTKCYPYRVANEMCLKVLVYPLVLAPLLIMPILYVVLTRYACLHNSKMKQLVQNQVNSELRRRTQEIKTLKTLGLILGIFYLSCLPNFVLYFVLNNDPNAFFPALAHKLFKNLATSCLYLGSLFNPVVYHRSSASFRRAFILLVSREDKQIPTFIASENGQLNVGTSISRTIVEQQ